MKSLVEHIAEQEELEERLIRTGALGSFASQARMHGDKSKQAFQNGIQVLHRRRATDELEVRLQHVEDALDAILRGLLHQRDQIGNNVALNFVGHSLANKK